MFQHTQSVLCPKIMTYCKIKDFSVDNSKAKSLNNVLCFNAREVKTLCGTYSFTLPGREICKYDHVARIPPDAPNVFPTLVRCIFLGCKSSANLNLIGILFAESVKRKVLVGWVMQH